MSIVVKAFQTPFMHGLLVSVHCKSDVAVFFEKDESSSIGRKESDL